MKRLERLKKHANNFFKQYARKAYPNHDPNDRRYDPEMEKDLKKLSPEEFDEIMNGEKDDQI